MWVFCNIINRDICLKINLISRRRICSLCQRETLQQGCVYVAILPRAGLHEQIGLDAEVNDLGLNTNAFSKLQLQLHLPEWRRHLVLHKKKLQSLENREKMWDHWDRKYWFHSSERDGALLCG